MAESIKKDATINPKRRGLGRGLSALFDDEEEGASITATASDASQESSDSKANKNNARRQMIGLDQLEPGPFQPRKSMAPDALDDLAASIAVHGVLQPILVREKPGKAGQYQIIAGERRWRAAQKAQLHEVPVIIKELSDEQATEIALIENLQREDLNAIEEALTYQRLTNKFAYTQEKLSAGIGKSRSHIANMMRLLTLPQSVQTLVMDDKLSAGHARALIGTEDPAQLAKYIVAQGLSVREAEKLAAQGKDRPTKAGKKTPAKDADTRALENELTQALGMRVTIDVKGKGKSGTVKIAFKDLDQLDEVIHRLSHRAE